MKGVKLICTEIIIIGNILLNLDIPFFYKTKIRPSPYFFILKI